MMGITKRDLISAAVGAAVSMFVTFGITKAFALVDKGLSGAHTHMDMKTEIIKEIRTTRDAIINQLHFHGDAK